MTLQRDNHQLESVITSQDAPRNPVLMTQDGHRLVPLQFETLAFRALGSCLEGFQGFVRFAGPGLGLLCSGLQASGFFSLLLLACGSCREACLNPKP